MRFTLLVCIVLYTLTTFAQSTLCSTPQQCNTLGKRAYEAERWQAAINFFELQVDLAEADNDTKLMQIGYNNLAMAYYHQGKFREAYAWIKVALADPEDKAARYNAELIQNKLKGPSQDKAIKGTYKQYAGGTLWNILKVNSLSDNRIEYSLSVNRAGRRPVQTYGPAAIGEIAGQGQLEGRQAVVEYRSENDQQCFLRILFEDEAATLEQQDPSPQCAVGGLGVAAHGRYLKTEP